MNVSVIQDFLLQMGLALVYYAVLITVMRLAGKRLAGQTTTFDLVILITISVVLQTTALREGVLNALIFIATVFGAHQLLAGLRKLGYPSQEGIKSATLEETGQISVIPLEREEPARSK